MELTELNSDTQVSHTGHFKFSDSKNSLFGQIVLFQGVNFESPVFLPQSSD
jgi:hypothetical protein